MNSPGTESKFVDVCLIPGSIPSSHIRPLQEGRSVRSFGRESPAGKEHARYLSATTAGRQARARARAAGIARPCGMRPREEDPPRPEAARRRADTLPGGSSPRGAEGKEDPQPRPRRLENSSSNNSSSNSKRPCTFPSITSEDPPDLPPRPRRRRPCRGSRNTSTSTSTSTSRGHIRGVRTSTNISSRRWGWEEEARAPTGDRTTTPRVRSPRRRRSSSSSSSSIACLRSTGAALVPKARCPRPPSTRSTPTSSSSTLRPLRARAPPRTRFTVRTVGRG